MPREKRAEGTRAPNGASSIYLGQDGKWHGRVTMGVKDNGQPDRRHVERKTETEVIEGVRELERQRDAGMATKAGSPAWTVESWLTHWVETVVAPSVRETTLAGYRVAVYKHLIPGLRAHRLRTLKPEHLEKLYAKMIAAGAKPGTAHQVHRTAKTAFTVAIDREHMVKNPAKLAKAPRVDEDEIIPFTAVEGKRVLAAAVKRRNGAIRHCPRSWSAQGRGARLEVVTHRPGCRPAAHTSADPAVQVEARLRRPVQVRRAAP
jgi:hypothetical protein